ncbi:hypothetical protein [Stenotrophomonas humi]
MSAWRGRRLKGWKFSNNRRPGESPAFFMQAFSRRSGLGREADALSDNGKTALASGLIKDRSQASDIAGFAAKAAPTTEKRQLA